MANLIALAALALASQAAAGWDGCTPVSYDTLLSVKTDANPSLGPDGLYATTADNQCVYVDASAGSVFSQDHPEMYAFVVSAAKASEATGLDFLSSSPDANRGPNGRDLESLFSFSPDAQRDRGGLDARSSPSPDGGRGKGESIDSRSSSSSPDGSRYPGGIDSRSSSSSPDAGRGNCGRSTSSSPDVGRGNCGRSLASRSSSSSPDANRGKGGRSLEARQATCGQICNSSISGSQKCNSCSCKYDTTVCSGGPTCVSFWRCK